ncbi:MAG: transcriptional regulator [Woeseia sp.]|nr:transcriptional regulator [Woeseia sp.]|tara:strand:+ start:418 stop:690 length:273 start_codon:yes stop_codon:yes gene_type:complete
MGTVSEETILKFPCQFPIKIMGRANNKFRSSAIETLEACVGKIAEDDITSSLSNKGKFTALTVTIEASSKRQLDDIYKALSANPDVLFLL